VNEKNRPAADVIDSTKHKAHNISTAAAAAATQAVWSWQRRHQTYDDE